MNIYGNQLSERSRDYAAAKTEVVRDILKRANFDNCFS